MTIVTQESKPLLRESGFIENEQRLDIQTIGMVESIYQLVGSWQNRPSWDEYFMAMAALISSRSSCNRLQVGCVLVSSGEHPFRVIAAGYNGFLPGLPHTSHVRDGHEQMTVHAEQNALTDAARRGVSVNNAIAYITHFPCINCAKLLAASGVQAIKYHGDYNNDALVSQVLKEANIPVSQL